MGYTRRRLNAQKAAVTTSYSSVSSTARCIDNSSWQGNTRRVTRMSIRSTQYACSWGDSLRAKEIQKVVLVLRGDVASE